MAAVDAVGPLSPLSDPMFRGTVFVPTDAVRPGEGEGTWRSRVRPSGWAPLPVAASMTPRSPTSHWPGWIDHSATASAAMRENVASAGAAIGVRQSSAPQPAYS